MPHPDYIARYWGKGQPDGETGPRWHPLAFHSLDVLACAMVFLDAHPRLLRALARLTELAEEQARAWALIAIGLHDIGKFTPAFQTKFDDVMNLADPDLKWRRLGHIDPDIGHAHTGAVLWDIDVLDPFLADWPEVDPFCLQHLLCAASGHHGQPARPEHTAAASRWTAPPKQSANPLEPRQDALGFARAVIDQIAPGGLGGSASEVGCRQASWLIAGLTNLADWTGSDQTYFPYRMAEEFDGLPEYFDYALAQAACAMTEKGLMSPSASPALSLAQLLNLSDGSIATPTPLQDWALSPDLARAFAVDSQIFAVIEDFTGAGKTEAALLLAHRVMTAGGASGQYWALPTQATSNAIFARLGENYRRFFDLGEMPSLALAHGGSNLHQPFADAVRANRKNAQAAAYGGDRHNPAEAECNVWLASDKRTTLLADVGVGTIDQALLAVMPSRFNVLRLLGLSRGVLLIDEAHSYDSYMNTLMERLVTFQAMMGGSVVILSATLTTKQRETLTKAFASGVDANLDEQQTNLLSPPGVTASFPSAMLAHKSAGDVLEVIVNAPESARGTRRDLPVDRVGTPEQAEARLLEIARAGGCAVYVRNTVKDALDSFDRLRAAAPDPAKVDLFHARFTVCDRAAIEARVLEQFGKSSTSEQRSGRILVATQVIEQSLDLDFDAMASDLAPIDLLIQRAGRLHRHDHRPAREAPCLILVCPEATDNAAANWLKSILPGSNAVYPNTGRLWTGLREITARGGLNLKSENPRALLDAVYERPDDEMPDALGKITRELEGGTDAAHRAQANHNALNKDHGYLDGQARSWDDEARVPTRLGEMARAVRLAVWSGDVNGDGEHLVPLAWASKDYSHPPDVRWQDWARSELRLRHDQFERFIPADAAEEQAVAVLQKLWLEHRDDTPLVVLRPEADALSEMGTQTATVWQATIATGEGANERIGVVRYSDLRGWSG